MSRFIIAIVVLAAGLILGTNLAGNKGYVLVALDKTTYETTVTTAVLAITLLFIAIQMLEWLLLKLLRLNASARRWLVERGRRKAESSIAKGFIALASGEYQQASSLLSKGANSSASPLISYLAAAVAAKELGDIKMQNKYLQQAESCGHHPLAILLTQAKFQLHNQQYQQANDTLMAINELKVSNNAILRLKQSVFVALQQWSLLLELLPELKKAGIIDGSEAQSLLVVAYEGRFNYLAEQKDQQGLADLWNSLPRKDKKSEAVRLAIASAFIKAGDSQAAYQLLGDLIRNKPNSPYLYLLAKLELEDYYPVLEQVRALYEKYDNNIELQSIFAQLLVKAEKWQEAKPVLEFVLSVREGAEDRLALALALEKLGQYKEALQQMKAYNQAA